jgi:hypothetical protein
MSSTRNPHFATVLLVLWTIATLTTLNLQGQNASFQHMDSVAVVENGNEIRNPGLGGLNLPQFSPIDLNGDNILDLIVFDRAGNKLLPFLNSGTPGLSDYRYAPQFEAQFPSDLKNFVLTGDFDCDGKMDLFTSTREIGVKVYHNTSTAGNLSFTVSQDTLFTDLGAGRTILIVSNKDIPGFVDVDSDGDLDVLTFDAGGSFLEFHKNLSIENSNGCSGFELIRAESCWGHFQESSLNQSVTLNIFCRVAPVASVIPQSGRHAGSTVAAYDGDGDGDMEVLLGDLIFDGLTYLHNGGTASAAMMDSMDVNFPAEDQPVSINIFPAAYVLDLDNDGKKDLVVSPNADNISVNYDNAWFYKNVDSGTGLTPSFQTFRFLVDQSIDVGSGSSPVLFDYNADGLLDLVVGNYNLKTSAVNTRAGLALYENIGSANSPRFELITRDFAGINGNFNPDIFGLAPTFGDLDGDGDQDMLVGDADGRLHYFDNVAQTGQPADFILDQGNFAGIDVGGFAYPVLVDWDRDGLLDIISGEWSGKIKYYRNTGTNSNPAFSSTPTDAFLGGIDVQPICCTGNSAPHIAPNPVTGKHDLFVGTEDGNIHYYPNAEQASAPFIASTLLFGGTKPGKQSNLTSGDINGDGKRDWILGNLRGGLNFFEGDITTFQAPETELSVAGLMVFPNPGKDKLTLELHSDRSSIFTFSVTDLMGRIVLPFAMGETNEKIEISTQDWANGTYFIKVQTTGKMPSTRKWVKSN